MDVIALRLQPGDDLRRSLLSYCIEHSIDAAYLLSAVGSLDNAVIRFADASTGTVLKQRLEIIALNGTLSRHGLHLHIALADGAGQVLGEHLLEGSIVYTTAEIVLGLVPGVQFERRVDQETGYLELAIAQQTFSKQELSANP